MEPKYFIGQRITYNRDYHALCAAPVGTLVYTPSGKIVERGAPDTSAYYGTPGQDHYYEDHGEYVIVGLPNDKVGELAKELWAVRSEALADSPWQVSPDFATPDHEKTYRALADYVLAREAAL